MAGLEIVSVQMGVLGPLSEKLSILPFPRYLRQPLNPGGLSISEKVHLLEYSLAEMAKMEEPDMLIKEWMRQVREVAYDLEDCIDLFVQKASRKSRFFFFLKGPGFIMQLQRLKARIDEAQERRLRYNLDNYCQLEDSYNASSAIAHQGGSGDARIDSRLISLSGDLVAVDGPSASLVGLLKLDEKLHVKVVSIFGIAGIGKTTLAMELYRKIEHKFRCRAFVYAGRRASTMTVLMNIIRQVSHHRKHDDITSEHLAIIQLRKLLRDKRYLIIIDDIWSISSWKAINCALPQNKIGSRIIVITCLHDVAIACSNLPSDSVFVMKPLDDYESKELFHRRTFGLEETIQKECSEVYDRIMKVCGGLPGTLTVLTSLLARAKLGELYMLKKSILETEIFGKHPLPMNVDEISPQSAIGEISKDFGIKTHILKGVGVKGGSATKREKQRIPEEAAIGEISATKGKKEHVPKEDAIREVSDTEEKKERVPYEAGAGDISIAKGKKGILGITVAEKIELQRRNPLQEMMKILHVSYTKLPFPIKSCFLYLCVFPDNSMIDRDRLIWRWIAEGFIPGSHEIIYFSSNQLHLYETGRSYFYELINRSLIEPVFSDDSDEADPLGCMVHGLVHDFIVSLSIEENFVMLDEELGSGPRDVIRRLSLNYTKEEDSGTKFCLGSGNVNLSQARSLTVFGRAQQMPHLENFQLLRVLDLEDAEGLENGNLDYIGRLFNLIYLGLGGKRVTELPKNIGELKLLQTLEIRRTEIRKLPAAASQLRNLVRILAKALDEIPGGVDKMQNLEELSTVSVNSRNALNFVTDLALYNLRVLGMKWCCNEQDGDIHYYRRRFEYFLRRMSYSEVNSLSIECDEACSLDFLLDYWGPPYRLQKLVMKRSNYFFRKIPMGLARCQHLTYLEIGIDLDWDGGIMIIASLDSLTILKISARGKPFIVKQGFKCLKVFLFQRCEGDLGLVFEEGTMPWLQKLCLHFQVLSQKKQQSKENHSHSVSGLQQLRSLKHINVKIDCSGATLAEVESVEEVIKQDTHLNRKNYKFKLSRDNEAKMKQDGDQGRDIETE